MGKKKKTKEEFIKEARKVHGDKYDYSKIEYVNNSTKVKIICRKHGEFWQTPSNHLNGKGCQKCGGSYVPTTEEWIASANKVHNGKYNYSKVEYIDSNTKVCIICPEHGEFWQEAKSHLSGRGCKKCANEATGERRRSSKSDFIKKSREVHGDKYDYSKVKYVNSATKVCIICSKHGEFLQTPSNHTQGQDCPMCANESNGDSKRYSKEDFIIKAREQHGDKYDYSKVKYEKSNIKVCIICSEHGEFKQTPNNHLRGQGCPKCRLIKIGNSKRLSLSDFIKKANEKHDGKYDYDKVKYKNNSTKVCIICPEHGEFKQTPAHHLNGCGCPKCGHNATGKSKRSSKEDFIKKARKEHGDKYDYSKVKYKNCDTKVCIICKKHGEFLQTPYNHLKGTGCHKCANEANGERCRLSKEDFIKKAREEHGDKYIYTKVEYVNANTKVCIICPEHGEFWQRPSDHNQGQGCPKCKGDKIREKQLLSVEEFIKKANEKHNDKYKYSNVKYVDAKTKVCIICSEHGEFWQTPDSHARGCGCPKCNLSHLERSVMNYLDDVGITYDSQKRFDWLGLQSLDFYLPDYNVGIECQGEQHFFPVERFGGDEGFKKILERDKRKFKKCQKNGIKVLYYSNLGIEYPYDVFEDLDLLFKEIKN